MLKKFKHQFKYQPSIRQKITMGYYAIGLVVIGLSIFVFIDLRFVGKKIMFGEVISEFFDTTLEIRRFEKNYFLYQEKSDFTENIKYVTKARELIENNVAGFATVAAPKEIAILKMDLKEYGTLMEQYAKLNKEDAVHKILLEGNIRKTGKEIVTIAEGISRTERKNIQTLLYKSQRTLVFTIIALSLLGIVVCQALSMRVVRPLKLLEDSMRMVAEGGFEKIERISINSKDREIMSLTNAFNKMIKELELRQRHLVQSEKLASLGTLLAGVAHELNNPLSNISLTSQILMEEIEERSAEQKRELLSMIDEQTERAKNIVSSLLEFSRDTVFKKEAVPLKKLFEETIRFVKGQVPTRTYITLDIPDDLLIYADKQRLQQAFLNLLKNAIEAISGEGNIFILARKIVGEVVIDYTESVLLQECQRHLTANGTEDAVYIKISDTGKGIEPAILSKIFDPFFTTKDVGKGSGLGLSIIHEIIEEHDGCITVKSEVGKGTTFLIRLPIPKEIKGN